MLKRAYDPAAPDDGFRIYIDRLWPRGMSHDTFHYDMWDKEIAPSTQLREWFHADPATRWEGFKAKYSMELKDNPAFAALLREIAGKPRVTLLYSSRDHDRNNAVVVKEMLMKQLGDNMP